MNDIMAGSMCPLFGFGFYFTAVYSHAVHVWCHSEPGPDPQFHPGTGTDAGTALGS